jgi:Holliday junction resolvase RusA-like endonuclease
MTTQQFPLDVAPASSSTAGVAGTAAGRTSTPGPPLLDFYVFGKPAPQGSKRMVPSGKPGGRMHLIESSKNVKPWREAVVAAAVDAMYEQFTGSTPPIRDPSTPLAVDIVCTFDKPKSAPKRRRTWPVTRSSGDGDKIARSCLDALTSAGAMRDDSQVVDLRVRKVFVSEDAEAMRVPGAHIRIYAIDGAG